MKFTTYFNIVCDNLKKSGNLNAIEKVYNQQEDDLSRINTLINVKDIMNLNTHESYQRKSKEKSENLRSIGNKYYGEKHFSQAISTYTRSISYAERDCKEIALAYANRSAVLYELGKYRLCVVDIQFALENKYPLHLIHKLYERLGKALMNLQCYGKAVDTLEKSIKTLNESNLSAKDRNEKSHLLFLLIESCREKFENDAEFDFNVCNRVYQVTPPVITNANNVYPCASKSFTIIDEVGKGRHAIADEEIHAGEIIIVEKPYTSLCLPHCFETHCYHCLQRFIVGYPCRNCASVRYCSVSCEENSWLSFHQYECCYMDALTQDDIGLGHLALKMISVTGFPELESFEQRLKSFKSISTGINENNLFDSKDYFCAFSLVGNSLLRESSDLFRRSILAIFLTKILETKGFFLLPKEKNESFAVIAAHLLKQIQMLPCNAHEVSELELTGKDFGNSELKEIGSAVYTTLSLLNHSCDPSVVRHCYGDTCVLRAIKNIRKGEPIVDNYGFLYAVEERVSRRQHIEEQYYFSCLCNACVDDWPLYTALIDIPVRFQCYQCKRQCTQSSQCCSECKCLDKCDLDDFKRVEDKYKGCMENVLDTGEVNKNLPVLLKYLDCISKCGVLPNMHLNNCQEIVKLCFSLQANFVEL